MRQTPASHMQSAMSDFTPIAAVTGTPEALLERELPGLVFEVSKSLDVCVSACVPSHRRPGRGAAVRSRSATRSTREA